jgi:hypothetical protein
LLLVWAPSDWTAVSVRDVQTWLNKVAKTCQCCAQGKDARRPASKRRCCALGRCCDDVPAARTIKGIRAVLRSALSQAQVDELVTNERRGLGEAATDPQTQGRFVGQ